MATGRVREWHQDQGWGVVDSDETPGGCWVHFSALRMAGDHQARTGQLVSFTYQPVAQDGFAYQALDVTIEGIPAAQPDPQPAGAGYHSHPTVESD
jgi:CspA family cold shock protein